MKKSFTLTVGLSLLTASFIATTISASTFAGMTHAVQHTARTAVAAEPPTMQEAMQLVQNEDWAAAKEAFQAIVDDDDSNNQAWFYLSYVTHANGELDEAIKLHKKIAKNPQFKPIALYNLGCAYSLQGKKDKAFEALEEARKAGFNNIAQVAGDSDLDNLRSDPRFEEMYGKEGKPTPKEDVKANDNANSDATNNTIDLSRMLPEQRLEFLVGSWEIHKDGYPIGKETVERILDGSAIQQTGEMQIDEDGTIMKYHCIYVFDQTSNEWKATWVSNFGHYDLLTGKLKDGKIVLDQKIVRDKPNASGRLTLHNITKNGYAMQWDLSEDEGKTYENEVKLQYKKMD